MISQKTVVWTVHDCASFLRNACGLGSSHSDKSNFIALLPSVRISLLSWHIFLFFSVKKKIVSYPYSLCNLHLTFSDYNCCLLLSIAFFFNYYLQLLFSVLASQSVAKSTEGEKQHGAADGIVLPKCSHVSSRVCERLQERTSILRSGLRNNSRWCYTRRWQEINEPITSVEEALCRFSALAEFTPDNIIRLLHHFTAALLDMYLWL